MDEVILHPLDDKVEDTLGIIESVLDTMLSSTVTKDLDAGQRLMITKARTNLVQVEIELRANE